MKKLLTLSLLFCMVDASALVMTPKGQSVPNAFAEPENDQPVDRRLVVQLPSKIKVVHVAVPGETKYVSVPERAKVVVASEFVSMKKEWDAELEGSALEIALKYSYRLDTEPSESDDAILKGKKADLINATKAAKDVPGLVTRKALEGAVNRMIAR